MVRATGGGPWRGCDVARGPRLGCDVARARGGARGLRRGCGEVSGLSDPLASPRVGRDAWTVGGGLCRSSRGVVGPCLPLRRAVARTGTRTPFGSGARRRRGRGHGRRSGEVIIAGAGRCSKSGVSAFSAVLFARVGTARGGVPPAPRAREPGQRVSGGGRHAPDLVPLAGNTRAERTPRLGGASSEPPRSETCRSRLPSSGQRVAGLCWFPCRTGRFPSCGRRGGPRTPRGWSRLRPQSGNRRSEPMRDGRCRA